ncbi:SAM-dependent methyltransferase, partial [Kluyvera intermedia]|uniref:N-6 DNA methylase n=1 Tax=Kluyvera intermedia TaxID=61648 RepID=UPI001F302881
YTDIRNIIIEEDPHYFLRSNESINTLRESGVFFTGEELSADCARRISHTLQRDSKIVDPCCGAGNLLIALSKHLPVEETLSDTLIMWNSMLHGYDLYEDFIYAAKLRLVLEAIRRGVVVDEINIDKNVNRLKNIKPLDFLSQNGSCEKYTHVIINPPYNQSFLKEYKYWCGGKVNLAAVFIDKIIASSLSDMHLVAILPDVLRSGTRYEKWREEIGRLISGEVIMRGRFDSKTDVDVFILDCHVKENTNGIQWVNRHNDFSSVISDYFSVSIGRVVPYRDEEVGNNHKYIFPGLLKSWDKICSSDIISKRKHKSVPIQPPFITIKRTSSPKDKNRAGAHLIYGSEPVFVENHLIIVKPFDDDINTCEKLLTQLKSYQVNSFLNDVIRCRHLTVKVVKEIPFDLEVYDEKITK